MAIQGAANTGLGRNDRRVGHLRVRGEGWNRAEAVRDLVAEALRLTSLPGEEQGWIYFFRKLRWPPLGATADPMAWIKRCGEQLQIAASGAQWAGAATAAAAVVYFRSSDEPFELRLQSLLTSDGAPAWFWPLATGVALGVPAANEMAILLGQWRRRPAGWLGVATSLLPALQQVPPARALEVMAAAPAASWLEELGGTPVAEGAAISSERPVWLAADAQTLRAWRQVLPSGDPRLEWLARLIARKMRPMTAPESLPRLACDLLQQIEPSPRWSNDHGAGASPKAGSHERAERLPAIAPPRHAPAPTPAADRRFEGEDGPVADPRHDTIEGEATQFAGLYFLLAPIARLGIAGALATHPRLDETRFVARLLRRLAIHAGVPIDDPILTPLRQAPEELSPGPSDPVVFPSNLTSLRCLVPHPALTERLWAHAVRLWVWDHARLPAAAVIARRGRVLVSKTALEVTLPLQEVDLRIRRCGLDLDPGYLPWFGRVVHFHYEDKRHDGNHQRWNGGDEAPAAAGCH